MRKQHCPSCTEPCVMPYGNSDILLIGEFPGEAELQTGIPFSTHPRYTTAGEVLKKELARVGLQTSDFVRMNLWVHEPNKNENCHKVGYDMVLEIAKTKKAILLVGSDVVDTFTKYKVSDVSGLQVDSPILSCPIIYAMVNPALALHRGHGEVRLAIEKFSKRLKEEGLV